MAADLNTLTLPRRAILAVGAAGLLPALPVEATPTPDAELLRLGQAFEAAWAFEHGLWKAMPDDDTPAHYAAEERAGEAHDRTHDLVKQIKAQKATTLAGLRVKARAAKWMNADELFNEADEPDHDFSRPMAVSILNDLLNLGA